MSTAIAIGITLLFGPVATAQVLPTAVTPLPADRAPIGATAVIENGVTVPAYTSFYSAPTAAAITTDPALSGPVLPYSYFAAPAGFPPRIYVPYGPSDRFAFDGDPYGYPYDRWTWMYMSGSPPSSLVRYYYPPVR